MTEWLQNFHFLRPELLLLVFALPVLWWLKEKVHGSKDDWTQAIDPALLAHLRPKAAQKRKRPTFVLLQVAMLLLILCLAGPSWIQKPQPLSQKQDDLVVIMDLSISMLATDVAPDRLTRAKQKLQDLLNLRREGNTALIVFSGDAHVVTPLTDDTNTILANLPALDPFMMPVIGSRPDLAVEQARALLIQGGSQSGRVVLLTDGVEPHQSERIADTLGNEEFTLSVLSIGTPGGGPIDLGERGYLKSDGAVVIPKLDKGQLEELAESNGGLYSALTLDDRDLSSLDIAGEQYRREDSSTTNNIERTNFDTWEDAGYWLLLFAVPLILLCHHRSAFLLILVFVFQPNESWADEAGFWDSLWQTPDQLAEKKVRNGDFGAAAELYTSPEHKAWSSYKAGDYEAADALYKTLDTDRSAYNRGNALAQQRQFEDAIAAYEDALNLNPENGDARYNKELLEAYLQQQNQQNQQNQSEGQDAETQDAQEQDSKNTSESEAEKEAREEEANARAEENKTEPEDASEAQSAIESPLSDEEKQSFEQWMRRVPDDPSALLRRKFEQQARERNRQEREEGEPLW